MADALPRLSPSSESRLSEVETGELAVTKVQASKDFSRQLAADYESDKMHYLIEPLKRNPSSAKQYRRDSALERLYLVSGERERLCVPKGKLRNYILHFSHNEPSAGHPG